MKVTLKFSDINTTWTKKGVPLVFKDITYKYSFICSHVTIEGNFIKIIFKSEEDCDIAFGCLVDCLKSVAKHEDIKLVFDVDDVDSFLCY